MKFHILEVRKEIAAFREVDAVGVMIGGIPCFLEYSHGGGFAGIYDAETGARVSMLEDSHEEALVAPSEWLANEGQLRWRDAQMAFSAKYGRPPEQEIQIIQEPQLPGEPETCSRETLCGHH